MKRRESQFEIETYKKINLVADPIHGYIQVTWPSGRSDDTECTERDIIDTPWLQRLRRIHQLQAVWWVFPGGEHTRFQHSLGAMHLGGLFASHLYKSLRRKPGVHKSKPYVEETMRLAGLLHDVGHGPFCHFFDEQYLRASLLKDEQGNYVNHEILGQKIIREKLADAIVRIGRSPGGKFKSSDGHIEPDYLCYLIRKDEKATDKIPAWVRVLKGLMTGVYTIDNLDYVWRDAYMCGIAPKPIDIERIKHYTFTTENGLVLYQPAISALEEFLRFRFRMYFSVYYHRTVRAIELQMREIFGNTIKLLYGEVNPYQDLDTFLSMDDWSLLCGVQEWLKGGNEKKKAIASEWNQLLDRKPKLRCLHELPKDYEEFDDFLKFPTSQEWEGRIKAQLGWKKKALEFKIDRAEEDPRRLDPLYDIMYPSQVKIYDPKQGKIDVGKAQHLAKRLPEKSIIFRLYAPRDLSKEDDKALINAFESVFRPKVRRRRGLSTST